MYKILVAGRGEGRWWILHLFVAVVISLALGNYIELVGVYSLCIDILFVSEERNWDIGLNCNVLIMSFHLVT